MTPKDFKVSTGHTAKVNDASLSEEDKAKLEQTRLEQQVSTRNQALTDSISGNKKEELEEQYQAIKQQKSYLKSDFNSLHEYVGTVLHPNYTDSLRLRAKAGWKKLGQFNIWQNSKQLFTKFQTAGINLRQTGSLGGIDIGTKDYDNSPNRLQSYVADKENTYSKQYQVNSENYDEAVQEFQTADNNSHVADRTLTDAIESERGLVADMRLVDGQMRNISIQQGYLA